MTGRFHLRPAGRNGLRAISAACMLALALPARAGLFDDGEARARVDKLRADVTSLQQTVDTASKNQLDFSNQLDSIRAELARLRGRLEVLENDMQTTQKRQQDFYIDLDTRLRKLEPTTTPAAVGGAAQGAPSAAAASGPAASAAPGSPGATQAAPAAAGAQTATSAAASAASATSTPAPGARPPAAAAASLPSGENTGSKTALDENAAARDYEVALGFVKAGRYRDAINAFAAFNRTHVGSVRQPNAHYWQASSHYQLREFAKAADQYARVVAGWPNDPKAPDAMLGQANAQFELGDSKAAKKTLEALIHQYPQSSAAQTAQQRLKKKS